jgi:hypothetical protein
MSARVGSAVPSTKEDAMSESSFGPDEGVAAGSTVEGEGGVSDSATADQAAAYDDPVSSQSGRVRGDDAVVASPPDDSEVTVTDPEADTSHDADAAAGYEPS